MKQLELIEEMINGSITNIRGLAIQVALKQMLGNEHAVRYVRDCIQQMEGVQWMTINMQSKNKSKKSRSLGHRLYEQINDEMSFLGKVRYCIHTNGKISTDQIKMFYRKETGNDLPSHQTLRFELENSEEVSKPCES